MNLETLLARHGKVGGPARAALVGAGEFGASFVAQARKSGEVEVCVICDLDPERAVRAALAAGHAPEEVRPCPDRASAEQALADGAIAVVRDVALATALPVDAVLEATGDPEGAARTARLAIEAGRHVVMATKEAEVVVGPILAHRAAERGVVHTPVDGDQPSLLIGLVGWARSLGFTVVCAGKASESDFVWDGRGDRVTAWGRTESSPGLAGAFRLEDGEPDAVLATRARAPFARTTVPDLCEMGIVANHTGLAPDRPDLHAPIARTVELPTLFRPRAAGGLLADIGRVDMFNCLRRPDELSFAGGVFVVVEAPDAATGRLLRAKGLPTCPDGRYVLLHNPVHLLGAEAPASVIAASRLGCSTGGVMPRQHIDLVGRASRDLEPGERLSIGTRHVIDGLDYRLEPARTLAPSAPVPYYLADGAVVRRRVAVGSCPTLEDLELRSESVLQRLRSEQDRELGVG